MVPTFNTAELTPTPKVFGIKKPHLPNKIYLQKRRELSLGPEGEGGVLNKFLYGP